MIPPDPDPAERASLARERTGPRRRIGARGPRAARALEAVRGLEEARTPRAARGLRAACAAVASCVLIAACGPPDDAGPSSAQGPVREGTPVEISEQPRLSVGVVEGDTLRQFHGVVTPFLLPNGTLAVPLSDAGVIRLFGPDGEFLQTLGRPGEGPGEGGRWLILSSGGVRVGSVKVPDGLEPTHMARDAVVGIRRDELGVESVSVHSLQRQ